MKKLLFAVLLVSAMFALTDVSESKYNPVMGREVIRSTLIDSVSESATFVTDLYDLRSPHYSVYASWTDTSAPVATWAGTISLQASVDGVNWKDVTSSDVTMDNTGSTLWNKDDAGYLYGRVRGVVTAGSATVDVKLNRK